MAGSSEQVNIDLTANDKASKTIDKVAGDVETLEKADPEVGISADDKATKVLDKVADDVETLEKSDPEITITADDKASADIRDVKDDVDALSRADTELVIRAQIDQAKTELKTLQDRLQDVGRDAQRTEEQVDDIGRTAGPGLAGNAIADLTGPLGDASGAASDFAGVFEGLGDIVGTAAGKVGLNAEKMAGAIGGIGVAVAVAAAAWTYFHGQQDKAKQKAEELVTKQKELNEALDEGDTKRAAEAYVEAYGDIARKADEAGVSISETTRFITGQTDVLPSLEVAIRNLNTEIDNTGGKGAAWNTGLVAQKDALEDLRDELAGAQTDYKNTNGAIDDQDRELRDVQSALKGAKTDTNDLETAQKDAKTSTENLTTALDRMRGELDVEQLMIDFKRDVIGALVETGESAIDQQDDIIALKTTVLDVAEELGRTPMEVKTVLEQIDQGDLQAVAQTVNGWYDANPAKMRIEIDRDDIRRQIQASSGVIITGGLPRAASAAPEIGTINMTLPAGWRGDPIRMAAGARRRTGRYFARVR